MRPDAGLQATSFATVLLSAVALAAATMDMGGKFYRLSFIAKFANFLNFIIGLNIMNVIINCIKFIKSNVQNIQITWLEGYKLQTSVN